FASNRAHSSATVSLPSSCAAVSSSVARFLVGKNNLAGIRHRQIEGEGSSIHMAELMDDLKRREDDIHVSLEHLSEMSFLEKVANRVSHHDYLTAAYREFLRACYPEDKS